MKTYKGYKIVGGFPQYDIYALNINSTETEGDQFDELVQEWDRGGDPTFIQIWTYDKEDQYWSEDGDFEGEEFDTVEQAKAAIDEFVEEAKNVRHS